MPRTKKTHTAYNAKGRIASKYNKLGDKVNKDPSKQLVRRRKNSYKKERARGRQEALDELKSEQVVAMLGSEPVYVHSTKCYYLQGLATAQRVIGKYLTDIESQVKAQIDSYIPAIDAQLEQVYKACHFTNWEEFSKWWEAEVLPCQWVGKVADSSVRIQLLALLDAFKRDANAIQIYQLKRDAANKTGNYTQLVSTGLVSVETAKTLTKGSHVGVDEVISKVRAHAKEMAGQILPILQANESIIDAVWPKEVAKMIKEDKTATAADMRDMLKPTMIGNLSEAIVHGLERDMVNGVHAVFKNVAAERNKQRTGGKETKSQAEFAGSTADTTVVFDGLVTMPMSDKTGMLFKFGTPDSPGTGAVDRFTASLESTNLNFGNNSLGITSMPDNVLRTLYYAIRNEDYWGAGQYSLIKQQIVAIFAWAKIVSEIVGTTTDPQKMPWVIRAFGRLYKTTDVLRQVRAKTGIDILKGMVVQEWQKSFAESMSHFAPTIARVDFRDLKGQVITLMRASGQKVTYAALHSNSTIAAELANIQMALVRNFAISTHFSIIYNNDRILSRFESTK